MSKNKSYTYHEYLKNFYPNSYQETISKDTDSLAVQLAKESMNKFKHILLKNKKQNMNKTTRRQKGFTLIELMLVVIILGILASVAVVKFAGRAEEARKQTAKSEISGAYGTALQLFEIDCGRYPTSEEGLSALKSSSIKGWKGPYLKTKDYNDPWGNPYQYKCPGTNNTDDYDLSSFGADGKDGGGDDVTNWGEDTKE